VISIDALISGGGLATPIADVALGPELPDPEMHWQKLYTEAPLVVARRDHPGLRDKQRAITREQFNGLRHVDTHLALGRPGIGHRAATGAFDQLGLTRDIALVVPTFAAAAMVAAETDLLACLPRRVSMRFCEFLPVRALELPVTLGGFDLGLLWHERTHLDPGARFFRELIAETVTSATLKPRAKR